MNGLLDTATIALVLAGGLFCVIGGIGLHRFRDFYQRIHAASITDTAGAGLILVGLMFQAGLSLVTLKLALALAFLLFSSPAIAHALVKAAHGQGLRLDLLAPAPRDGARNGGETGVASESGRANDAGADHAAR